MSAPARTGRGGQAGPALANGTAAAHTTGYLPDTSEYRKETDLGVGGGVAGDDGDGRGCPVGAVPVYCPAGVRWSGKLGAGVLQPRQVHRTPRVRSSSAAVGVCSPRRTV